MTGTANKPTGAVQLEMTMIKRGVDPSLNLAAGQVVAVLDPTVPGNRPC